MAELSDMMKAGKAKIDDGFLRQVHPDLILKANCLLLATAKAMEQVENAEGVNYLCDSDDDDQDDDDQKIPVLLRSEPELQWSGWYERSDSAFIFARDVIVKCVDQWYAVHGIPRHSKWLGQDWLPPASHPALLHTAFLEEEALSPLVRRCVEVCYGGHWRIRAEGYQPAFSEHSSSSNFSDSPDPSEGGTEDNGGQATKKESIGEQGNAENQHEAQGEHGSCHPSLLHVHQYGNSVRALTQDHPARRFDGDHPRAPYAPEVLRRREILKSRAEVKVDPTTASRTTPSRLTSPQTQRQHGNTQPTRAISNNMTNTNGPPFEEELRLVPPGSENAVPTVRGLIEERKELSEYQTNKRTDERTPVFHTPKPASVSRIPKFGDHFTRTKAPVEPSTGPAAPKAKALLGSPMVKSGPNFSGTGFFRRSSSSTKKNSGSSSQQRLINLFARPPNRNAGTSSSEPSPVKEEFKTPARVTTNPAADAAAAKAMIQELANRPKPIQTSASPSLMRKVSNSVIKAVSPTKAKRKLDDHPPTPPAKDTPPKADESDAPGGEHEESDVVRAPLYRNDMSGSVSPISATEDDITPCKIGARKEMPHVVETFHRVQSMSADFFDGDDATDELAPATTTAGTEGKRLPARSYSPPMDTSLFYSPANSSAQFVYSPSIYDNVKNKDKLVEDDDDTGDDDFDGPLFPSHSTAARFVLPESPAKDTPYPETLPKVQMDDAVDYPLLQPTTYQQTPTKRVSFIEPVTSDAQGDAQDGAQKHATRDSNAVNEDFQCPSAKPSPLRVHRRNNESFSGSYKSLRERYADGQRATGLGINTSPGTQQSDESDTRRHSALHTQAGGVLHSLVRDLMKERDSSIIRNDNLSVTMSNFTTVMEDVRQKLMQLKELDPKSLAQKLVAMEGDLNKLDTIGLAMLEVVEKVDHMEEYLSNFSDNMEDSLIRLAEDIAAKVKQDAESANEATLVNMNEGLEAVLVRIDYACSDMTEKFDATVTQINDRLSAMEAKVSEKEDSCHHGLWNGGSRNKHR